MANYSIKSVAFGGFDKQDVIRYIEQTAEEAAAYGLIDKVITNRA